MDKKYSVEEIKNHQQGDRTREIILEHIVSYIKEHGYPPSYREICEMTGIKSLASIHYHIVRMIECGMLETDCEIWSARTLRVPGYKFVKEYESKEE